MHVKIHHSDVAVAEVAPDVAAKESVRYSFNPSGLSEVATLKALAAAFIEYCDYVAIGKPEAGRELAVAKTNMQTASMWAVLAATKGL